MMFAVLLITVVPPVAAQSAVPAPDSARAQIRGVLWAYYYNLAHRNWDWLAAYVLSPKLLERRGAPGELQRVAKDRTRGRGAPHLVHASQACPSKTAPMIDEATIRLDGDWAEASVERCIGDSLVVDEFRLLYFEERWRFIYTDLFQSDTAHR